MESVPVEHFQDVEADPRLNCLSTPVVVRKILEHLSSTDLLKFCSFVNKLWNYEARSVLRERACLMAHLNSGHPCKDLLTFVSHLQPMNVIPFSGAHFDINCWTHKDKCEPSTTGSLDPTYKLILDRLQWKRLSVKLHSEGLQLKTCPGLLLVKSVLENHCESLEEFALHVESEGVQLFIQEAFENSRFPRLKVLKIHELWCDRDAANFIKALVTRSPNLKELHQEYRINFMENVLEGSSAVLITNYKFDPMREEFSESIIGSLRLKRMRLDLRGRRDFSLEKFNRIAPMLLQAYCTTLNSLNIEDFLLVPLMCYGISLENVTKLKICSNYQWLEFARPSILKLIKAFDFTRIFPRLNQVRIINYPGRSISVEDIGVFLEQGNTLWKEPMRDRAANIKHLVVPLKDYNALFFAQMFPAAESLILRATRETQVPYELIWENWVNLRELRVEKHARIGVQSTSNENFDSVFCGIFPEEVALLREKDDEFLKAVNIVPTRPSITCMKELRTFKLLITERGVFSEETDHTFIFSRVTGVIAFKRCPSLSVTLVTNLNELEKALGHMKPFSDIVLAKD